MKKKPLCVQELAHGKAENGDANWISAIATMFNADVIASGKAHRQSCLSLFRNYQFPLNVKLLLWQVRAMDG